MSSILKYQLVPIAIGIATAFIRNESIASNAIVAGAFGVIWLGLVVLIDGGIK
jgi:hypothetical protein